MDRLEAGRSGTFTWDRTKQRASLTLLLFVSLNSAFYTHFERKTNVYTWRERKRISLWNDLKRIGEIPCARNSLLTGIGAGVGIGFVRGMNASKSRQNFL